MKNVLLVFDVQGFDQWEKLNGLCKTALEKSVTLAKMENSHAACQIIALELSICYGPLDTGDALKR